MRKLSTGQKKKRARHAVKQRTAHDAAKPIPVTAPPKRTLIKRLLTLFSYLSM